MPVIGFLDRRIADDQFAHIVAAFRHGLNEAGYVEGQNVAIEYRWAEVTSDRLPALAVDLVRPSSDRDRPAGHSAALAAKAATTTIPIVFATGDGPGRGRTCREPEPTGRKPHGRDLLERGARAEAAGATARVGARDATIIAVLVNPNLPLPRRSSADLRQRRPPKRSGCSSTSCTRAPKATWTRSLQPWSNCGSVRS